MRQIDLQEYCRSEPYPLSVVERDALKKALPSLTIEPAVATESEYCLTPASTVGAIEIGELSVLIQPKIGIPQMLSLACYAMDAYKSQQDRMFDFKEEPALPDTLALALAASARRAFAQGLLHGYRTEEEALYTVRGRIRFNEQIRNRFGTALPIEVRYDEFTDDILANRLVKAAVARLGGMRLRSQEGRRRLRWVAGIVGKVSYVEFLPSAVPEVRFDRLNEHYRDVVTLSRLILRHSAFEVARGEVRASGFLVDMNALFQVFVTQALREATAVSDRVLCSDTSMPHRVWLDQTQRAPLKPDLSWWEGGTCTFVGDAKYKNITGEHVPNADLYQLLSYATALDLPGGLLVYAKGEADTATYRVRQSDKRLYISTLDLSGTLAEVLKRLGTLADRVKALRDEALSLRRAA